MAIRTLPQIAAEHGLNLDLLRKLVRARPELDALGQRVGRSRAYSPDEAAIVATAMKERYAKK